MISRKEILSIHSITNRKYALADISPVFQGRDIMAPAAAYLSLTVDPSCLGRACQKISRPPEIEPIQSGGKIKGRVLRTDRFGNLITNIDSTRFKLAGRVIINGLDIGRVRKTFSSVGTGRPVAYIGSGGHLEIAVRDGSAFKYFSVQNGAEVQILVAR